MVHLRTILVLKATCALIYIGFVGGTKLKNRLPKTSESLSYLRKRLGKIHAPYYLLIPPEAKSFEKWALKTHQIQNSSQNDFSKVFY